MQLLFLYPARATPSPIAPPTPLNPLEQQRREPARDRRRGRQPSIYRVNCTVYDALAGNDLDYLLCRAIQFLLPGVPQVYYVGLLAGRNDPEIRCN